MPAADARGDPSRRQAATTAQWVGPAVLFSVGLLLQSTGLMASTAEYVRWMDTLDNFDDYLVPTAVASKATPDVAISDAGARFVEGAARPELALPDYFVEVFGGHQLETLWLEALTSAVPLFWMGWIARTRNLQLWTRTLIAGALCAALKGLLAWTTVAPDVRGWASCQERLGQGGLEYYRRVARGEFNLFQSLFDKIWLVCNSIWMIGSPARTRYCADSLFCVPVCFCGVAALGLYDCARDFAAAVDRGPRMATVCGLIGTLLGVIMLVNIYYPVANNYHYSMDVAVACILALLVYSNPAVALAAEKWAAPPGAARAVPPSWPLAEALGLVRIGRHGGGGGEEGEGLALEADADLTEVGIAPCCLPFCALGGVYFLRDRPAQLISRQETRERVKEESRRKLAQLGQTKQEVLRQQAAREAELKKWKDLLKDRKAKAEMATEKHLRAGVEQERKRLDAAFKETLAQAEQRLARAAEQREAAYTPNSVTIDSLSLQELDSTLEAAISEKRTPALDDVKGRLDVAHDNVEATRRRIKNAIAAIANSHGCD